MQMCFRVTFRFGFRFFSFQKFVMLCRYCISGSKMNNNIAGFFYYAGRIVRTRDSNSLEYGSLWFCGRFEFALLGSDRTRFEFIRVQEGEIAREIEFHSNVGSNSVDARESDRTKIRVHLNEGACGCKRWLEFAQMRVSDCVKDSN